jgi:hypothetical protein
LVGSYVQFVELVDSFIKTQFPHRRLYWGRMAPTLKRPSLSGFSILDEYLHDDGPLKDSDCESVTEKLPMRRKSANIDRKMETKQARIFADYFSDNPVFNEKLSDSTSCDL